MKKIFILFILILSSSTLYASGATNWFNVVQVWSYSGGELRVFLSAAHSDPDSCGNSTLVHFSSTADKNMYTTVITALTSNKQVSFFLDGCLSVSGATAAKATRVAIQ